MFILDIEKNDSEFDTKDWVVPNHKLSYAKNNDEKPLTEKTQKVHSASTRPEGKECKKCGKVHKEEIRPREEVKQQPKRDDPKHEEKIESKKDSGGLNLESLLPLLTGGGSQMDMISSLMGSMGGNKKGGGFDFMSLLPMLMNGGLGSLFGGGPKADVSPQTINLDNYKRIR